MLNTNTYKNEILDLHSKGYNGKDISRILGFKNHQPVYNFFRKYGLDHPPKVYKRKYTLDEDYFRNINTEDKAYILGFICADGFVEKGRVRIAISRKDVELLHKIKYFTNSNAPIKEYVADNPYLKSTRPKLNMVVLSLCSQKLTKPLLALNLHKNKTYTLNSDVLKAVPRHLIRDFLRGYFDGDGNVLFGKKYNSGVKYNINVCGNEEFLLNTFQKHYPSINKLQKDNNTKQMCIWKVSSKEGVIGFLKYLYENSNIFLTRKYKNYLISKRVHLKPI